MRLKIIMLYTAFLPQGYLAHPWVSQMQDRHYRVIHTDLLIPL